MIRALGVALVCGCVGACGGRESTPPPDASASFDASLPQGDAAPSPDGDSAAACATWDAAVEIADADADGAPSVNADGGSTLPGPAPTVCSRVGNVHAPLAVVNHAPCAIEMWWVDYECKEQDFGTVPPNGGTWTNDAWETHPWRIRAAASGELLVEIPPLPEGAADTGVRSIVYP